MIINDKLKVRTVAGENIVIMQSSDGSDMTRVVALNESALLLYNRLSGRNFEIDEVIQVLIGEYEVDEAEARKDAVAWVDEMKKNGLIL
jgi:hypothetical protein